MKICTYPLSAIVGCESSKIALECVATTKDITAILICGSTGTGKTTIARAIKDVMPDKTIVTMPTHSTPEQIFGGIDVESAVKTGKKQITEHLLKRSDGNIILIENLNFLQETVAGQVLNAVTEGKNTVEREGISLSYNFNTTLIATMDPAEGELSEHLLDRFDICLFLSENSDETERREILDRRLAYERDADSFRHMFSDDTEIILSRVNTAIKKYPQVAIPQGFKEAVSDICNEMNVEGHRGDISVMHTSCAIAALDGRDVVNLEDLRMAVNLCLQHRRKDVDSNQQPESSKEPEQNDDDTEEDNEEDREDSDKKNNPPSNDENHDENFNEPQTSPKDNEPKEEVFAIGKTFNVKDYIPKENRIYKTSRGKRESITAKDSSGKCVGHTLPKGKIFDIAICASIRAAAPHQINRKNKDLAIVLTKEDLREKVRQKKQGTKILFVVDGSGSMGANNRMVAVKGAIFSLLKDAYQKRDEVGMVVFRNEEAEEILPLTRSVYRAYLALDKIPTGGKTPLMSGLKKGYEILIRSEISGYSTVMVLLTDGRCNVSPDVNSKPIEETHAYAKSIKDCGIRFIVVDTETGLIRFNLAHELSKSLDCTYIKLEELSSGQIASSVKKAMEMK